MERDEDIEKLAGQTESVLSSESVVGRVTKVSGDSGVINGYKNTSASIYATLEFLWVFGFFLLISPYPSYKKRN